MANKKKPEATKPLHTVKRGQVVATVELRMANSGYQYPVLSLSRRWITQSSKKEATGTCFFAEQETDICEAVKAACAYMRNGAKGGGETSDGEVGETVAVAAHSDPQTSRDGSTDA